MASLSPTYKSANVVTRTIPILREPSHIFNSLHLPPENLLYGLHQTIGDPSSKFVEWYEIIAFRYSSSLERLARPYVAERNAAQRRSCLWPDRRKTFDER